MNSFMGGWMDGWRGGDDGNCSKVTPATSCIDRTSTRMDDEASLCAGRGFGGGHCLLLLL